MNNSKVKTFISDQGEIFEGTRQELMSEYGIKHSRGFIRPSGAVDSNGDRWKEYEEDTIFEKPKLYLGGKIEYDRDVKGKRRMTRVYSSNTAANYELAEKVLKSPDNYRPEDVEQIKEMKKTVESQYNIIDNRRFEAKLNKMSNELLEEYKQELLSIKDKAGENIIQAARENKSESLLFTYLSKISNADKELALVETEIEHRKTPEITWEDKSDSMKSYFPHLYS